MIYKKYQKIIILASSILLMDNKIIASKTSDKIIAIVNNNIILTSDINHTLKLEKENYHSLEQKEIKKNFLYKNIIDQLITEELITQITYNSTIKINDNELNEIIDNIAKEHNMTTEQFYQNLFKNHISYNTYKSQIRKKIIASEITNHEMQQRIRIFPYEIHKLAKKISTDINDNAIFKLNYISIKLPKNFNKNKKNKNETFTIDIINKINKGENIENIIKNYNNHQKKTNNNDNIIAIDNKEIKGKLKDLPFFITEKITKIKQGNAIALIKSNNKIDILTINSVYINNQKISGIEIYTKEIFLKHLSNRNDEQIYKILTNIIYKIKNKNIDFNTANKLISEQYRCDNKNDEEIKNNNIEDFDPKIRIALMSLNKNEISEPIRTHYGWHVIKIFDICQVNNIQAIQKNYAYQLLYYHKFIEEMQNWIKELYSNSYIKILTNNNYNDNS